MSASAITTRLVAEALAKKTDAAIMEAVSGRTAKAQELLEIAFMLVEFERLGAVVDPPILGWARQLLWMNP